MSCFPSQKQTPEPHNQLQILPQRQLSQEKSGVPDTDAVSDVDLYQTIPQEKLTMPPTQISTEKLSEDNPFDQTPPQTTEQDAEDASK